VIGDIGRGVFVRDDIPDLFRSKIVPAADIITPNHFELDHLSARRSVTLGEARAAIDALHDLGPRVILVTSLHTRETPEAHLDVIVSDRSGLFRLRTPLLPLQINGAGDAIAALFLAHYLRTESAAEAMSRAVSSVFGVLRRTAERGEREIMLVAAQEELVRPSQVFEAQAIG
jgi:pyridoxine kinase